MLENIQSKNTKKEYLFDLYLKNNGYSQIVNQYAMSNVRRIDKAFDNFIKHETNGYTRTLVVNRHVIEVMSSTTSVFRHEGIWYIRISYSISLNGAPIVSNKTMQYNGKPIVTLLRVGDVRVQGFVSEFTPLILKKEKTRNN